MTVENLHDAIGLLPGDLIAAADEKRCRKPKRIPFRHYAAVAACLVLVVGGAFAAFAMFASGGGNKYALTEQVACEMAPQAPEAEDQAAPMEPAFPAMDQTTNENSASAFGQDTEFASSTVQVATPCAKTAVNITSGDPITLITSRKELGEYWDSNEIRYDFSRMQELCETYDEKWFETHDLLLNVVCASNIRERWCVTKIMEGANGWDWEILLSHEHHADTDGEAIPLHLMTPLEKGWMNPEDAMIQVYEVNSAE